MIETNLTAKELEAELKRNREYCENLFKLKPTLKHIVYAINIPKPDDRIEASDIIGGHSFYGMHILNGDPIKFDTDIHFDKYVNDLYKEFGSDITIYAVHNSNPVFNI